MMTKKDCIRNLIRWQKKAKDRKEDGVFVTEGERAYAEIPADRIIFSAVSESYSRTHDIPEGAVILTDSEFSRVSDTKTPQGILAAVRMKLFTEEEVLKDPEGMYILLETIQDPGNLGTILRAAEAAGVSGILMNRETVDPYSPKVIRSTMGALHRVPFAVSEDLSAAVRRIRELGGSVFAADLRGAVPYDAQDYTKMTAFLIGNEGNGLSEALSLSADRRIIIPMKGKTESLNAAMAAAILMFEGARQRRNAGKD